MKQIVYVFSNTILTLNKDNENKKYIIDNCSKLRYIKSYENKVNEIFSYNEFIEKYNVNSYPAKNERYKKKFGERYSEIGCYVEEKFRDYCNIKFSDLNFVSYKEESRCSAVNIDNLSLQKLMKELPVNDMIEFLKDNGLNICPVAR